VHYRVSYITIIALLPLQQASLHAVVSITCT